MENRRRLQIEEGIFILLIMLSLLGIGITHFEPEDGYGYWLFMVLIFGMLAVLITWLKSKQTASDLSHIVKEQALHWFSTLLVVAGAFFLEQSGRIDEFSASLVILLILSLATMLDGIRIGWQLSLVGFFLGACAVILAFVENFMPATSILAIIIISGSIFWELRKHKQLNQ